MNIISAIRIEGFRSIRSINVSGIKNFTTFAGINNSGKSNVLRALNAFFNGKTDLGEELSVNDDYCRFDLSKKRKKTINVSITFDLPRNFKFRNGLEEVKVLLEDRSFEIEKRWHRQASSPAYFLNGKELSHDDRLKVDQFLQLINFRYIPNRVLPIDIIRGEAQALRDVLVRRLKGRDREHDATFSTIRETSRVMIRQLSERLTKAVPGMGTASLSTPTSWSDIAFIFGYRFGQENFEVPDAVQGSGIQSMLMLETLYLIDRGNFQRFGWNQAAIWAVEEPESSLHTSLEAQIAFFLSSIASDPLNRIQVLSTTHSDLMIQYSDTAILVEKNNDETTCQSFSDMRSALTEISGQGISRWVHPLLYHPRDVVILVEGKYDVDFFKEAFKLIRPNREIHVACLEDIGDEQATGGVDHLKKFINDNASVIKARFSDAPVVVILDWDTQNKGKGINRKFSGNDHLRLFTWPESSFNDNLDESFRGIERHFSDRMIESAKQNGARILRDEKGVYSVTPTDFPEAKKILNEVVREGLKKEDIAHAKDFIIEIFRNLGIRVRR